MTVKYRFIEKWKLVIVEITNTATYDQMVAHLKSLSEDPRYQPPMKKLIDLRNCHNYDLSREEAEKFAALNRELGDYFINEKCAIVAPGDLEFGMSRFHELSVYGSGIVIQVFRNLQEAQDWLGIDNTDFEPQL